MKVAEDAFPAHVRKIVFKEEETVERTDDDKNGEPVPDILTKEFAEKMIRMIDGRKVAVILEGVRLIGYRCF